DGVLAELVVAEGGSAALGAVIARIAVGAPPVAVPESRAPARARARATPVARRLARELGVALEGIPGTGPGGRIVRADVRAHGGNGTVGVAGESPQGAAGEMPPTTTQPTNARRTAGS